MRPPTYRVSFRACSSILAPLVLLGVLWLGRADANGSKEVASGTSSSSRVHAVPGIRMEHSDVAARRVKAKPPAPAPAPAPVPAPSPARTSGRNVFAGLGAWIDLYDFDVLSVGPTIRALKANGVDTLYLQTGRSNTRHAVEASAIPWLVAAHRAGLKVVGWYLPDYRHLGLDVLRTRRVATFQYEKIGFDGVGVDIEFKGAVPRNSTWNRRVVSHMHEVRKALGPRYPLAAIAPPPLQMRLAPSMWAGFPWRGVAAESSEIMLMSYWSVRSGCPSNPMHCAYQFTKYNVLMTRSLTGNKAPIHIIGGIADGINGAQLDAFVRGARDARADGASIYDVATTPQAYWPVLRALHSLGP
ncbi:MAG: hypothetical protein ACXVQ6_01535 [Actinomycetota bacterium]